MREVSFPGQYCRCQELSNVPRCNKSVIAEKKFTVHEAPLVLTVHLKRFSPMGRKIGHHIKYDDHFSLRPAMSEGQHGPSYLLYGVICHAGGGPNSGHYYAHVKASDGRWYEMNDESVTMSRGPPVGLKNAYILFYIRDKGQALEAAITKLSNHPPIHPKVGLVVGMKKRKILLSDNEDDGEDKGVKAPRPFIGPQLSSPLPESDSRRQVANTIDPQADLVKKKIEAASKKPETALSSLSQYCESEEEDEGDGRERAAGESIPILASQTTAPSPSLSSLSPLSSPPRPPPQSSSPSRPPITVSAASFYATSSKQKAEGKLKLDESGKKRKSQDNEKDVDLKDYARTPLYVGSPKFGGPMNGGEHFSRKLSSGGNPYNRLSGGNNLRADRLPPHQKYGNRRRHII